MMFSADGPTVDGNCAVAGPAAANAKIFGTNPADSAWRVSSTESWKCEAARKTSGFFALAAWTSDDKSVAVGGYFDSYTTCRPSFFAASTAPLAAELENASSECTIATVL